MNVFENKKFYQYQQIAAALGVHKDTIRGWLERGSFPRPLKKVTPKARRVFWQGYTLNQWLAQRSSEENGD